MENNQLYDYDFNEIKDSIIGRITEYPRSLKFVIYQNKAPQKGDKVRYNDEIYECISEIDITTDSERDEGLSYSEVELMK